MEGATVSLSERREMISSEGGTSTLYHGQYHLGEISRIKAGQVKDFELQV